MQAGGHRFDPDRLHHAYRPAMFRGGRQIRVSASRNTPEMKTRYPAFMAGQRGFALRFFDIVNGFLIDAVVHWCVVQGPHADASLTDVESG